MLHKEKVITAIKSLPNEFTIDEVVEVLTILQKIKIGLKQVAEGKTLFTAEPKSILLAKFPHLEI